MGLDFSNLLNDLIKNFDAEPNLAVMFVLAFIGVVVLGSAFLSAALAEDREHNRLVHFLLGLVVPWVYPLVLYRPGSAGAGKKRRQAAHEVEKEETSAVEAAPESEEASQEEPGTRKASLREMSRDELVDTLTSSHTVDDITFTQRTFTTIAGERFADSAGPYYFRLVDGNVLTVKSIVEIQPTMLVVEISAGEGQTRKLRLMYSKIQSFSLDAEQAEKGAGSVRPADMAAAADDDTEGVTSRMPMLEDKAKDIFDSADTVVDRPVVMDKTPAKKSGISIKK